MGKSFWLSLAENKQRMISPRQEKEGFHKSCRWNDAIGLDFSAEVVKIVTEIENKVSFVKGLKKRRLKSAKKSTKNHLKILKRKSFLRTCNMTRNFKSKLWDLTLMMLTELAFASPWQFIFLMRLQMKLSLSCNCLLDQLHYLLMSHLE